MIFMCMENLNFTEEYKMQEERKLEIEDECKCENEENNEKPQVMWMPICMCFGLSIGMSLGNLIFDNMSIGMCMGISLGVAVGSIIDARNRVNNKEDKQITSESDDNEENE